MGAAIDTLVAQGMAAGEAKDMLQRSTAEAADLIRQRQDVYTNEHVEAHGFSAAPTVALTIDEPPLAPAAYAPFQAAARRLKAAEIEYKAAQQAYGEAWKQLSDGAVR